MYWFGVSVTELVERSTVAPGGDSGFIALVLIRKSIEIERGATAAPRPSLSSQPLERRSGCSPALPYPPSRLEAIIAPRERLSQTGFDHAAS